MPFCSVWATVPVPVEATFDDSKQLLDTFSL